MHMGWSELESGRLFRPVLQKRGRQAASFNNRIKGGTLLVVCERWGGWHLAFRPCPPLSHEVRTQCARCALTVALA